MSNVINFTAKPVQLLWKPSKKTRAAWRIGTASGQLIPMEARFKKQANETASRQARMEAKNSNLVRDFERVVDDIVEREDQNFDPERYADALGDNVDHVIKEFCDNFSSGSIGVRALDDMEASELLQLALKSGFTKLAFRDLLVECSEAEACGYCIQYNEIDFFHLGEEEYQIDVVDHEDLKEIYNQMSDAEKQAAGAADGSVLAYGRPCERVILKLDAEKFLENLAERLNMKQEA